MPLRHDLWGGGASWEACHGLLLVIQLLACVGAFHEHGTERALVSGPAIAVAPSQGIPARTLQCLMSSRKLLAARTLPFLLKQMHWLLRP